jgi:hypothetical protein
LKRVAALAIRPHELALAQHVRKAALLGIFHEAPGLQIRPAHIGKSSSM